MEKTWIKLSRLKLLREKNEAKKQELNSRVVVTQQEVIDLQNNIRATKVEIKKTFQAKEKKLNQLDIEFIMVK